jgi:hypothetical protein
MQLNRVQIISLVSGLCMLYTAARVVVQFLEALSMVQAQRAEDIELIELCKRGDARGSSKMRTACMHAHADLASPLVFKATVHAVSLAFAEFCEVVGSPTKLAVLALFLISGVAMPIVPWARWVCGSDAAVPAAPLNGIHYVSYSVRDDDEAYIVGRRPTLRSRWDGALKRIRALPKVTTGAGDHDDDLEVQFPEFGDATLTRAPESPSSCARIKFD